KNLLLAVRPGVGRAEPEPNGHLEVGTELDLMVHFGPQVAVPEDGEAEVAARGNAEGFVLRREVGRASSRAVRSVHFELADVGHRPPRLLRDPPSTRHTTERRPTIAQSEQGTAIPTNQRLEH